MKLLDVQEIDTRIDTVRHQLASIPEAAELAALAEQQDAAENEVRDLRISVSDLTDEQQRADADVELVRSRRERDRGMVDSGAITDPKALQNMLGELESLERRISTLEDVEIDVMERLENAQGELAERTAAWEELQRRAGELETARAAKAAELERSLTELAAEREQTASGLPGDLLDLYQRLRDSKGGIGAAALRRRECGGCRLTLNASDLGVIAAAPTDEVVRCEECGRILVRTGESGL